jgi:hypothetical protein
MSVKGKEKAEDPVSIEELNEEEDDSANFFMKKRRRVAVRQRQCSLHHLQCGLTVSFDRQGTSRAYSTRTYRV